MYKMTRASLCVETANIKKLCVSKNKKIRKGDKSTNIMALRDESTRNCGKIMRIESRESTKHIGDYRKKEGKKNTLD